MSPEPSVPRDDTPVPSIPPRTPSSSGPSAGGQPRKVDGPATPPQTGPAPSAPASTKPMPVTRPTTPAVPGVAGGGPSSPPPSAAPTGAPVGTATPERKVPPATPGTTRAAAAWIGAALAIVMLVLLIVLMLQNQEDVEVRYLGLVETLPLGVALLISSVIGATVVLVIGIVRLTQLRINARRARRFNEAVAREIEKNT